MRTGIRWIGTALAICLNGCGTVQGRGGTGSEAGNGLAVVAYDTEGRPVPGAQVEARDSADPTGAVRARATTGPDGRVVLELPEGRWSILVRRNSTAFWRIASDSGDVTDTLRATTRLAGVVDGGDGRSVAIAALGRAVACGRGGFFAFDDLPAGNIPLAVQGMGTGSVRLDPGVPSMVLSGASTLPSPWTALPADSLVPWSDRPLPATLPATAIPAAEPFSMAVRLWRQDLATPIQVFTWSDGGSGGLEVGWKGADTFVLRIGTRSYQIPGIPLAPAEEQVGIAWTGSHLQVYRDADLVVDLSTTVLADRSGWAPPVIGGAGTGKVDWLAFKRGASIPDWLVQLFRL